MSIVSILVFLIVLALVLYIIQILPLPIDATIKRIIMAVVCLIFLIWILNGFGYVNLGHFGRPL